MKSIITDDLTTCYICGGRATEKHHVMHGYSGKDRKLSEQYGLYVGLCPKCHRGAQGVHADIEKNRKLQRDAQRAFEAKYGHETWLNLFMRNYL